MINYDFNDRVVLLLGKVDNTHPQAIYTSQLLDPFVNSINTECLDCETTDRTIETFLYYINSSSSMILNDYRIIYYLFQYFSVYFVRYLIIE